MSPPRLETAPGCFTDVPSNVVELASEERVDEAWETYAAMARRLADDPKLLFDRDFNEGLARRHERWKRLFLMQDGGERCI